MAMQSGFFFSSSSVECDQQFCFAFTVISERSSPKSRLQRGRLLMKDFELCWMDRTTRLIQQQRPRCVNPMSFDVAMRDPIFNAAFGRLKQAGLDQMVWQTLGRVAADLENVASKLYFVHDDSIKGAVASVVQHRLEIAVENVQNCSSDVKTKLLPLFAENDFVSLEIVKELNITLSAPETGPDKVLRRFDNGLVPASPSMAFVLKHGLYASNNSFIGGTVANCREKQ